MDLNLHTLIAHDLDARPTIEPPAPIAPEDRSRSNGPRMQEDADLAWLRSVVPLPLALLTQRAGPTTTDARSINQAQTPIGFQTPLVQGQGCASRTTQCSIRLRSKVTAREAAYFPG